MIPPISDPNIRQVTPSNAKPTGFADKVITSAPSRSEQIRQLRDQVKSGTFPIDVEKLASSIIHSGELNK